MKGAVSRGHLPEGCFAGPLHEAEWSRVLWKTPSISARGFISHIHPLMCCSDAWWPLGLKALLAEIPTGAPPENSGAHPTVGILGLLPALHTQFRASGHMIASAAETTAETRKFNLRSGVDAHTRTSSRTPIVVPCGSTIVAQRECVSVCNQRGKATTQSRRTQVTLFF